jgi:16S rRNA (cytidine1402-2'-O)-methyltransferase
MLEILGDREAVVAREVTKIYEEFTRGLLSEIIIRYKDRQVKGEIILLLSPGKTGLENKDFSLSEMFEQLMGKEKLSLKDTVKRIAMETGKQRSAVYRQALDLVKLKK